MTEFYGEDLANVHAGNFEALAGAAAATLLAVLPTAPAGRVLDLGCGAGPLSQRLNENGVSTWGLDLSPALVQLARQRLPEAEFQCGSILDANLPTAAAAAAIGEVLNYATAEDADGLTRVLRRIFDALDRGGVFLFDMAAPGRAGAGRGFSEGANWAVGMIATEHEGQLVRRISTFRQIGTSWSRSYEEHRLRLWSAEDVVERLACCGFGVEQLEAYAGMIMPPSLNVFLARKPN
jgi:SAM-dependent methyltransferase